MKIWIAACLFLLALPGLVRRRSSIWAMCLQGLATVGALCCLGIGLLDLTRHSSRKADQRLWIAPTAAAERDSKKLDGRPAVWLEGGEFNKTVDEARLRRKPGDPVLLWWNGGFDAELLASDPVESPVVAVLGTRPLRLDPKKLRPQVIGERAAGRPVAITLDLTGIPPDVGVELRVWLPGGEPPRVARRLGQGELRLDLQPNEAGVCRVELAITDAGRQLTGVTTLRLLDPGTVDVVGVGAQAQAVVAMLKAQGLASRGHARLPKNPSSQVVLVGTVVSDEAKHLRRFVEDGGGLFVIGGADSAMAATNEDLQWLTPLRWVGEKKPRNDTGQKPEQPRKKEPTKDPDAAGGDTKGAEMPSQPKKVEVERRRVAMAIVIDRSYSMSTETRLGSGISRIDLAKKAAHEAALDLLDDDEFAVLSFGDAGQGRVVLHRTQVRNRARIRKSLEKLAASREGTYLADALDKAVGELRNSKSAIKHIVVITDGSIRDSEGMNLSAITAAEKAKQAGCTVTVLQVVPGDDGRIRAGPAQDISTAGGGGFVREADANAIPRLVVAEVKRTLGKVGRKPARAPKRQPEPGKPKDPDKPKEPDPKEPDKLKEPDKPKEPDKVACLVVRAISDSRLLEPRPERGFPSLSGPLPVVARPMARVLLVAGEEGMPLLAFQNRGLGRVGAWAAPLTDEASGEWLDDSAFPGRLALWLQSLRKPLVDAPSPLALDFGTLPAPVPAEVEALRRRAGGQLVQSVSDLRLPAVASVQQRQSRLPEFALWGALSLFGLLILERLAGVVRARPGPSVYPSSP